MLFWILSRGKGSVHRSVVQSCHKGQTGILTFLIQMNCSAANIPSLAQNQGLFPVCSVGIMSELNALNPVCVSDTCTPLANLNTSLVLRFPSLDFIDFFFDIS